MSTHVDFLPPKLNNPLFVDFYDNLAENGHSNGSLLWEICNLSSCEMSLAVNQIKWTLTMGPRSLTFSGILLISQFNPLLISPDAFLQESVLWPMLPLPFYHMPSLTHTHSLSLSVSLISCSLPLCFHFI
jgi:hypothetical protein